MTKWPAFIFVLAALVGCTTSFDIAVDDTCEGAWQPGPVGPEAPTPLDVPPEAGIPFNDPDFGSCQERLEVDVPADGRLIQATPEWLLVQVYSVQRATERSTGRNFQIGVQVGFGRFYSSVDYGYFRYALEGMRNEIPGPSSFCRYNVVTDERVCADLSETTSWNPPLSASLGATLDIRRRAIAQDEDGNIRAWAALVVGEDGARLALIRADENEVRHAAVPNEVLSAIADGESVRIRLDPTARYFFIATRANVWRIDADNGFEVVGPQPLSPSLGPSMEVVVGPNLVYVADDGALWFSDGLSPSTRLGDFAQGPCGEEASVVCDTTLVRLALPPAGAPGWVAVAVREDSSVSATRRPWSAGRIGLMPLREDAPFYSLAWHRGRSAIPGGSWQFSMTSGAARDGRPELAWVWTGSSDPTALFFRATLPERWWERADTR